MVGLALLAFGEPLIRYSVEAKPYALDAFVALLVVALSSWAQGATNDELTVKLAEQAWEDQKFRVALDLYASNTRPEPRQTLTRGRHLDDFA